MRKFIYLFACLLTMLALQAQENDVIHISVSNNAQAPLTPATVALHRLPDSALVKMQVTDSAGAARFIAPGAGTFYVQVSFAGYVSSSQPPFSYKGGQLALAPVILQASGQMAGITVTTRKQFVELKPGKTIVNMDAGITNSGTTVMEALEKMPGITVDKNGGISLKGKAGVLVMIDGKQTYLDPSQLATLLNGMSSTQVSQVEIMDQPSAAFDAAGNAGLINIKTKKNQQKGFNGSLTAAYAQGFYAKTNNNLLLNYRSGKWNFFSSYSVNANTSFSRLTALRSYFTNSGQVASTLDQQSFFKGVSNTHNLRAGIDYSLTPKTSVGLTVSGLSLHRSGNTTNGAKWIGPQGQTDSLVRTLGISDSHWKNGGLALNVKHNFSAGRELTADVDVIGYRMKGDQYFNNQAVFPLGYTEEIRAGLPADISIASAKADYTEQVKNIRLQAGVKTSQIKTDNLAAYEIKHNENWEADYTKTNHFLYRENIQAVYTNADTKLDRWSLQAGLRFETTTYDAKQLGNPVQKDSSFSRSYNSLFPSLVASFEADSSHTFSFSAGRRIDRPAFQKLNPFIFIINKYTIQRGNPFFRPQYTWNMELSHMYKGRFITAVGYSVTTDYFSQIFPVDGNGLIVYTEGNLGRLQQLTLSVSTQLSPAAWWSLSGQGVVTHKNMQGVVGRALQAYITQFTLNLTNQLRLGKHWSGELSGVYTSRSQQDIQEVLDPAGQVSLGLARNILQNKGTLKLAVRDIFYTQWMKGDTYFPQAYEYFRLVRDSRVAQLSFTYRFGKSFKTNRRSEGSAGEEVRRVGNG